MKGIEKLSTVFLFENFIEIDSHAVVKNNKLYTFAQFSPMVIFCTIVV